MDTVSLLLAALILSATGLFVFIRWRRKRRCSPNAATAAQGAAPQRDMAALAGTASSNDQAPRATLLALALICALGVVTLYQATLGFRVVSTEDGRRLGIVERPLLLPATAIHLPLPDTLRHALRADGRVTIATFFYARCNSVCSVLGSEFKQLQARIRERGLERQVRLLSISFDPRDTPAELAAYAKRMDADPALWQFAGINVADQRRRLLNAAGIVVLPAPLGEFQHNAAFHLIDADGYLVRIDDFDQPGSALEHALALAALAARRGGAA